MAKTRKHKQGRQRNNFQRKRILVFGLLLLAAFSFRVAVARWLPNDLPDDGKLYAQLARNLLEQHGYSAETEAPFASTLIRLPGYPLFLAGSYAIFGHGDNTAVRMLQAVVDTATCALIALVAFYWEPDEKRKRQTAIAALVLAAVCPFTTIYVATILTETLTMFLAVGMCLTATLALRATKQSRALLLWLASGLIAGAAVLFRPDSGLFALAIGITLVVATLGRVSHQNLNTKRATLLYRLARAASLGAVFSFAFCLALVPWTVRNHRVFHLFQPLAPAHAEMPGEFVPRGYLTWVRTWLDDSRYIGPVVWSLDTSPIKADELPASAFDSAAEKQQVAALFEKYDHPADEPDLFTTSPAAPEPAGEGADQETVEPSKSAEDTSASQATKAASPARSPDESDANDTTDNEDNDSDQGDSADQADENATTDQAVEMTPEIDAGFARIAQERIARHPFRYYVLLPLKRARTLWIDTHSQYYPFEGELLPLSDLDYDNHQQYWLPLFAGLTFLFTVLGIAGGWILWRAREFVSRQWLLLAALLIFLRLGFFATLENPEPRYVVEVFPFLSLLGGLALMRLGRLLTNRKPSFR
jgi:Dolichyl-phosphate-mannose-protein mannosyltransferase